LLLGLFISSFLAATLLPGGSEALLVYLLGQQPQSFVALVVVATAGNSLGSLSSYGLGYLGRVKLSPQHSKSRAALLIERYGVFALLLSWLPLIGDLICVLAGYFKLRLGPSLILIVVGKAIRYALVAWLFLSLNF